MTDPAASTEAEDTELALALSELGRADADLARAREIALEAVYSTPVAAKSTVSFGVFGRINPDHNPDAAPDIGFGTKFAHRF